MSSSSSSNYWSSKVGDAAHVLSLVNVMVFAVAVGTHRDDSSLFFFDPLWKEHGFCIMNPDMDYWTSHDLCLYADFFLGAVASVVYLLLKEEQGMQAANALVKPNLFGILGHGIGHGAIAAGLRAASVDDSGDTAAATDETALAWESVEFISVVQVASSWVPLLIFWYLMLKSALPQGSATSIALLSVMSLAGQMGFPSNFGSTYVQSVLFAVFSWNELFNKDRQDKGFEYAIYPLLVGMPLGVIGWIESTQCSKGFVSLGGHLVYDAYIPLSMLLFYMICWVRASVSNSTATTTTSSSSSKEKVA